MSNHIEVHRQIRNLFEKQDDFAIVSHVRPDGDAIGAVLALGLSLRQLGKNAQMVLADGVPKSFQFLTGTDQIRRRISQEQGNIICVDSSDLQRIGQDVTTDQVTLNIDHHITNEGFAKINLIESDASATCEILTNHFPKWGLPITDAVSNALLAGILNDTIGFKTPNVTGQTLRLSADLMQNGARLSEIYSHTLDSRSFEAARYWGYGLNNLQKEGEIVWTTLSQNDRIKADYPGNDDADLVNIISTIDDAIIAVIFIEQRNGSVKVSWRAKPGKSVSQIAYEFGGGGHKAAAGAEIHGSIDDVVAKVLDSTRSMINDN